MDTAPPDRVNEPAMVDSGEFQERRSVPRWGPRGTAAATFAARLSFENVSHGFGALEAVRNVSFELKPGEIICLLGPSGCGKTTMLRIAAGIVRPKAGRVLLDGREVAGPNAFVPPEARNVGLMFQDYALFPHLTILQNVAFGLNSMAPALAKKEARQALLRVGLAEYEDQYPHALSGGEQQRVALARAIVPRPSIMLMDEPFSGLDQRLRESVRAETLALLKETRASSVLVTHDPVEAMGMADRILLMRRGELIQTATPREIYHQPVDVEAARFFCDFNELPGEVSSGLSRTAVGCFKSNDLPEGGSATVMIRPHGFRWAPEGNNGTKGYVTSRRFLGDAHELSVQFDGLEQPVTAHIFTPDAPQVGELAAFTIDEAHVLVFANPG